jgi:hypothetical protein
MGFETFREPKCGGFEPFSRVHPGRETAQKRHGHFQTHTLKSEKAPPEKQVNWNSALLKGILMKLIYSITRQIMVYLFLIL